MNKLFRPKCMRRMAVFMALVAPIVYLFGSLFFALNGAHGQEVFAEPVYVEEFVEVDDFSSDGSYRVVFDVDSFCRDNSSFNFGVNVDFSINSVDYSNIRGFVYSDYYYVQVRNDEVGITGHYGYNSVTDSVSSTIASPWVIFCDFNFASVPIPHNYFVISKSVLVPSSEIPENAGAYSDYVFKNFFAKDNFLVQWGRNAISENPYGFAPFGYFWRYLDINFLHLSNEQVGLMGYGYMYYSAHVLLFDVGFILVTFFINVIQKVTDKIGGGDL